jgi:hypothetical protein
MFFLSLFSLLISMCRSKYEANVAISVVSFYFKFSGIDEINILNYSVKGYNQLARHLKTFTVKIKSVLATLFGLVYGA